MSSKWYKTSVSVRYIPAIWRGKGRSETVCNTPPLLSRAALLSLIVVYTYICSNQGVQNDDSTRPPNLTPASTSNVLLIDCVNWCHYTIVVTVNFSKWLTVKFCIFWIVCIFKINEMVDVTYDLSPCNGWRLLVCIPCLRCCVVMCWLLNYWNQQ